MSEQLVLAKSISVNMSSFLPLWLLFFAPHLFAIRGLALWLLFLRRAVQTIPHVVLTRVERSLMRTFTVCGHPPAIERVFSARVLRPAVLIVLVCMFGCVLGVAQALDRTIAQFAHTAWRQKDGAPSVVNALAQSADGYVWLGSTDGLYRFDGLIFERYQPQSGGPFPARNVTSLLALSTGDLWIGFRTGGISVLRDGHLTSFTSRDGMPEGVVWTVAQDRKGTIWAATSSGLTRLEGNRWKDVGKEWNFLGKSANTIFQDRQGTLWVSTEDTLVCLPPGANRFQSTGIRVGQVAQIAQAAHGKLWMAETTRSVRPLPLARKRQPPDEAQVQVGSIGILFDSDGALWITSVGDGLRRSAAPELLKGKIKEFSTAIDSFTAKDGLSDDFVRAIFQDREGNIWVGTNNGLDRFRKTNLVPVVLPFKPRYGILAAGDAGDAWVANLNVMVRVHGGRVGRGQRLSTEANFAYRDPAGVIWWLCSDGIYRYFAGKYTRTALPPSFPPNYGELEITATEDGSGALWLAALREGLFYLEKGVWQRLETASEFAKLNPRTAFTDWMGRAWFGYEEGTIIILEHKSIRRVFPANDSLIGGIRAINGRGRHTWVGGELGLAFFDGNRFRRIVPSDADAFGSVLGVQETFDGSLWLAETRGVVQIPASEVQQALDNPSYRVKYRLFDSFDGLPGTFAGVQTISKMIQGIDGRLWFGATDGVVWVDPANLSTNALPPPVSIRSVRANGRQPDSLANLVLPPRTSNLQIRYTALSLAVPEKVRFRYKLDGLDEDWQDVGTRREAFYTNLGPGKYRFHVIACNNDGVWNETGATLNFRVSPAWYQTRLFQAAWVLAAMLLVWLIYRIRMQRVAKAIAARYDERLAERTRIARDLHDTLLQTIQGSKLVADDALETPSEPARMRKALEQLSQWLQQAGQEGRAALNSLRVPATSTNDLAEAFKRAVETTPQQSMAATISVLGDVREIHPIVRDEVYRIGYEAIRNAYAHSGGTHLKVQLHYAGDLTLRIADDGSGAGASEFSGHKEGHFGLKGMRERASRIGARLTVTGNEGGGTEVYLVVPGGIAFKDVAGSRRSRLTALLGSSRRQN
jgi:signal transduction histidine kinase